MDVTYLDIGHTTLMCYWGHYGLNGQTTTWVITGWTMRLKGWWLMVSYSCRLEGFQVCGGGEWESRYG